MDIVLIYDSFSLTASTFACFSQHPGLSFVFSSDSILEHPMGVYSELITLEFASSWKGGGIRNVCFSSECPIRLTSAPTRLCPAESGDKQGLIARSV